VPHVVEQESQSDHNVHSTANYKHDMMQHISKYAIVMVGNNYLFRSRTGGGLLWFNTTVNATHAWRLIII